MSTVLSDHCVLSLGNVLSQVAPHLSNNVINTVNSLHYYRKHVIRGCSTSVPVLHVQDRYNSIRHGVNSIPELELMGNSNSNSGIGIGIGIACLKK